MSDLSKQVSDLSPEKRELLGLLLQEEGIDVDSTLILKQERVWNTELGGFQVPLSFAQQRLWFLDKFEPQSPLYNIPTVVKIDGNLSIEILRDSIQEVIARHETLRTTFREIEGEPYQIIAKDQVADIEVVDLCELPTEVRDEDSQHLILREAQAPFDLEQGPLFRVVLVRLSSQNNLALFTLHHIISDGWSMGILIRDVINIYQSKLNEQQAKLPEIDVQYADYAVWQRKWLQGELLEEQISYWQDTLDGAQAVINLPTDRPRPAVQTSEGASYQFKLSNNLLERMDELGKSEGATLFMSLLAAFYAILHLYTSQYDISIGTPIANRKRKEVENLIGFFVNTLVMRVQFSRGITFRSLLKQVKDVAIGAYSNQDVPFEMLVERLKPDRDMSHTPFFQVMFALQESSQKPIAFPGFKVQQLESHSGTATFDITLILSETLEGLIGAIEYNTDLFDVETIRRFAGYYEILLEQVLLSPDQPISDISLLPSEEYQKIVYKWNETTVQYPADVCLHHLFEQQVKHTPDKNAVVMLHTSAESDLSESAYLKQSLSYSELNQKANQLAHYLMKHGVGPETIVGIFIERSLESMVAILGILKAGGAFLPLDPDYPSDRLAFMLSDAAQIQSGKIIVLSKTHLLDRIPTDAAQIIDLEKDWETIACEKSVDPEASVDSRNLAYVIYTSGSTGLPKGVMVSHRSVINHNDFVGKAYLVEHSDRVLQFATLNFDASIEEIFPTWFNGATLVLRPSMLFLTGSELIQIIEEEQITILGLPTAFWHEWVSELRISNLEIPKSLKMLILGGEKAQFEPFKYWQERFGEQVFLMNTYGPTETTIIATLFPVPPKNPEWQRSSELPIGQPIDNLQAYILSESFTPVPIGIPGELYIGGVGVARGYLSRPEITAERFLPDPFTANPGSRLYRTGDVVKYKPDGNIEFIGRADHQLKIRGFRIELGEIEATLTKHPSVLETIVLPFSDQDDRTRLVAYLVVPPELEMDTNQMGVKDWKEFASLSLPKFMVPDSYVVLDELPLTPSGKVDRNSLPKPDTYTIEEGQIYIAPRNPIEEILVGSWESLLGVEHIGIHDDFFQLGGHSLLATRMISQIRKNFNIEIPIRKLFEQPTISVLAEIINESLQGKEIEPVSQITPISRDGELPLSFGQQRLWFIDQLDPHSAQYNIPDAVRVHGALDLEALQKSINAIIHRHEVLRSCYLTVDGKAVIKIAPEIRISIPVTDISHISPDQQEAWIGNYIREENRKPFNLSEPPLLRVNALKISDSEWVIYFNLHHIISDGWSAGVLINELGILYPAIVADKTVEEAVALLPELEIQYLDYAAWQREWLSGEIKETQLEYWKNQLAGLPPLLELPTDRPRSALQSSAGEQIQIKLSDDLYPEIIEFSQREGITLFMLLLAAFQALLHRYTGQDDIAVGTPIANRNRAEIEGLIGFFVNTLVMNADFSSNPTFLELVRQMREVALGAYSHQDLPFEFLVDTLQPERDLSHSPLFQVMFMMQSAEKDNLKLPGLEFSQLDINSGMSMFDLTLVITESPQGLFAGVEYNTDLFNRRTIMQMIGHLEMLLQSALSLPDLPVGQIPVLSDTEYQTILYEWNQTSVDYPLDSCVHHLIEDQVMRAPDSIAVLFGEVELTYGELNSRANQLAHLLRSKGIRSEKLVGVAIQRSVEMLVAILAILKSGGAYVPLDPAYPKDRLDYIIKDANVELILTSDKLKREFDGFGVPIIPVDSSWEIIRAEKPDNLITANLSARNLAYVIYTSGSTGMPKGVMVEHQSVVNHNLSVIHDYELTSEDRMLQFATINFDTAVEEIFPTLIAGGTLVLRNEEILLSVEELHKMIERFQITVLDLPTAYWHEWVYELHITGKRVPDELRMVVIGGEKCLMERYANWLEVIDEGCQLLNTYGPTEATIIASLYQPDDNLEILAEVPIGRPIANTRLYVLDPNLQPVPVGVSGELCIGGICVTRGYLNSGSKTAERFVPDPYSDLPGARMYRTGDLVRYLPDGNIEFIGRVDYQVKVRGFRVELGEIDSALIKDPLVKEAITLAVPGGSDHLRLVSYVVVDENAKEQAIDTLKLTLQSKLEKQIPEYMLPSSYVFLDEMPLTPSNKIDRSALPEPEPEQQRSSQEYFPPQTPEEQILADVWSQVLGIKDISITDNFFQLGGDSILSIQVIARSGMAGLRLTPRQLFENPTIAGLARVAEKGVIIEADQGIVEGDVLLTPIQNWFFEQGFPNPNHYNQGLLLVVNQRVDPDHLESAVLALIEHHDALRMRYVFANEEWRQWNSGLELFNQNLPNLLHIDLSGVSDDELPEHIEKRSSEIQNSLDIQNGLIFRVALFELGPERLQRLLIIGHHLVIDGVSWRIILEDLQTAYTQLINGGEISLPPKTSSFQLWASHLAEYATAEGMKAERIYWLNYLDVEYGQLRIDNPEGSNIERYQKSKTVSLTEEHTKKLLYEAPTAYKTEINDLLIAALAQLLVAWTGKRRVLIEMEGHGREDLFDSLDVSRTVGWFTSMFPVRIELGEPNNNAVTIKTVKEQLRAIPANGIGYGVLKYFSDEETKEKISNMPVPDLSFNYLGQFDQAMPEDGFLGFASESRGQDRDENGKRSSLIDITGGIVRGRLSFEWSYSDRQFYPDTIERMANEYIQNLINLIEHCISPEAEGFTPSDFPMAGLNQQELDKLLGKIKK